MSIKKTISKKLVALGLSASAAISTGYLIIPWEGSVKNKQGQHVAYIDAVGIPTACYGQTGKDLYGNPIRKGMTYSENECLIMLSRSVRHFENVVDKSVNVSYASPYQKAALISFTYNVGEGNFRSSTLLRRLNSGDHAGACDQLTRWVYAQKKKLNGLVARRMSEKSWCMGEVSDDIKVNFDDILTLVKELEDKNGNNK